MAKSNLEPRTLARSAWRPQPRRHPEHTGETRDRVSAQEVFLWAHGKGLSGKDPSPVTIGARMACLSSFFRLLIRMDIVGTNPCDRLERPRTSMPRARGLSAEEALTVR